MPDMEPITREEKILSGEDLEPITRLEYFLKQASQGGGGGGSSNQIMFVKAVKSGNNYLLPDDGVDYYDAIRDFIKDGDKLAVIVFEDYPVEDAPNYYIFYEYYKYKSSLVYKPGMLYFAYMGNTIVLNESERKIGRSIDCFCSIKRQTREIEMWGNYCEDTTCLDYRYQLQGTLTAGQTTLTLTDERISTDDVFDFYTSIYTVNPTDISVSAGSMTLTFEAQNTDLSVKVRAS